MRSPGRAASELPDRVTNAEQCVLGGLLLDNSARARLNGLTVEHFASEWHRTIFDAIIDQIDDGTGGAADAVTVCVRLDRAGKADDDTLPYLNKLSGNTPSAANIGAYANVVQRAANERQARAMLAEAELAIDRGDLAEAARVAGGIEKYAARKITATPYVWRSPSEIPPREFLFRKHYIRRFLVATAGPPGGAKSSIVLVDLVSMVIGRDLLTGKPLPLGPLRVWLYNTEDPRDEVERRLAAVCLHYGVSAAEIGDRLHIDTAREQKLVVARQVEGCAVAVPGVVSDLTAAVKARGIEVFVADPLIHTHAVPENDNTGMAEVMSAWREVAERGNCCVELIHHVRKNGGQDTTADDMRGAVAILGSVRSLRLTTTMSKEDAKQFGIDEEDRRFHVWANPTGKPSLVPPLGRRDWYFMQGVDLGNATGVYPADHVGVATRWNPPDVFGGITLDDARRAWAAIRSADAVKEGRADPRAQGWVGRLVARAIGLEIDAPGVRPQITKMLAEWERSGTIKRAVLRDSRTRRDVPVYLFGTVHELCDEGA